MPRKNRPLLSGILAAASVFVGVILVSLVPVTAPVPPPTAAVSDGPAGDPPTYAMGWVRDEAAIAAAAEDPTVPKFAATPAGQAKHSADEDVLLFSVLQNIAKSGDGYPSRDQGPVGSCVGNGFASAINALLAVQIKTGSRQEWKKLSAEYIYATSRVDVGNGRLRGDGSLGSWAAKAVQDLGVVPMENDVAGVDLGTYSASRCRTWGRPPGVPSEVKEVGRKSPVKSAALVRTWAECQAAIRNGYPIAVCSGVGFRMQRDSDGFCRASGSWAHCMAIIGIRGGSRPGAFILNSWGDNAHTGPRWPANAPAAGFWAEASTVGRMLSEGDSYAMSDAVGFPSRKIDWRVKAEPANPFNLRLERPEYALAP